ncbi:hypothetical protein EMWEY_00052240, partial [Eimeria maxima]
MKLRIQQALHESPEVALPVLLHLAIYKLDKDTTSSNIANTALAYKLDKDTTSSNIANTALAFFFCRFGKVQAARG